MTDKKKYRGKRTHGRGNTKHGRGKGSKKGTASSKGGRNYMNLVKGGGKRKKGFNSHRPEQKGINLRDIKEIIEKDQEEIDVTEYGYDKILGGGNIDKSVKIKARSFSKTAEKKINEAGGEAIKKGE